MSSPTSKVRELVLQFERNTGTKDGACKEQTQENIKIIKKRTNRQNTASFKDARGVYSYNYKMQAVKEWAVSRTQAYENVNIRNFSSSWSDGLAFCAIIHSYYPDAFQFSDLSKEDKRRNFHLAFTSAQKYVSCDPLLEVDDMIRMGKRPDSKSVFVYVSFLRQKLLAANPEPDEPTTTEGAE